ncbi:uncharacterized protein RMCC_2225 [Mycolicibacterium canariasense]|uniref:Uncharacterized protein n=1 Tax=Mycolicibacterium canariasense TaxID=228230 RepID=A0A100WC07_MYCCR|nr:uncharacterized protein RMCC_2225 [Mycolicibacterium canariasense]
MANAVKNASAVGSGPFGLGVQALNEAAVATTAITAAATRETDEVIVAIETDVKDVTTPDGGGAPRPDRDPPLSRAARSRRYPPE